MANIAPPFNLDAVRHLAAQDHQAYRIITPPDARVLLASVAGDLAAANARIAELENAQRRDLERLAAVAGARDAANARADAADSAGQYWAKQARSESERADAAERAHEATLLTNASLVQAHDQLARKLDAAERENNRMREEAVDALAPILDERDQLAQKLEAAERLAEAKGNLLRSAVDGADAAERDSWAQGTRADEAESERDRLAARVTELESLLANQWPGR